MAITQHPQSRFIFVQAGFTLAELILTLAIGTILTTMAIPAFSTMLEENRLMSEIYEFIGHLNYARHAAITKGRKITLCKSQDGKTCDSDLGWEDGWIAFVDTSSNHKRSSDEPLLRVYQGKGDTLTINYKAGFGRNDYVVFKPLGRSSYNGTFTFCAHNSEIPPRAIIIYRGRVRISRTMPNGDPLECPQ